MDIHVRRVQRDAVEVKVMVNQESFICGTISGENSDMNVQATEITAWVTIISATILSSD